MGGEIQEKMKGERDEVFTEVQHSKNYDVLGFYLNESSQNPVGISDPYFLAEEADAQREEIMQLMRWFQVRALGTLTFFPRAFVSMTPCRTKGVSPCV